MPQLDLCGVQKISYLAPANNEITTSGYMMTSIEQHIDWIAECIEFMESSGHREIEANLNAENEWMDHADELAGQRFATAATRGISVPIYLVRNGYSCLMLAEFLHTQKNVARLLQPATVVLTLVSDV